MKIDIKVGLMMEIADCAASWVIILKWDMHGGWIDERPPTLERMVTPIENPPPATAFQAIWSGIGM